MNEDTLSDQAVQLESLLPTVMRRLFTLQPEHPVSDLPLAQLRVCIILQAGARPMSVISEELGISISATTQIADRLERAGLVERVSEPDDRRMKNLRLTPQGKELMRLRREVRVKRAQDALEGLAPEVRETLLKMLNALLEAAKATAPLPPREDPVGVRVEQ